MHRAIRQRAVALRARDGGFDQPPVLGRGTLFTDIAAIDGETGEDLAQSLPDRDGRVVASFPVGIGNALEVGNERLELAREASLEDICLRLPQQRE